MCLIRIQDRTNSKIRQLQLQFIFLIFFRNFIGMGICPLSPIDLWSNEQKILRFQITVNHATTVGRIHRRDHGHEVVEHTIRGGRGNAGVSGLL